MLQPNDRIGPFRLISLLGQGGSGIVWLAERQTALMNTRVAVKIPHNLQTDIEVIRQEMQAWVHASGHPNILPVLEADIYDGYPAIVSEYVPGGSLSQWLQRNGGRAPSMQSAVSLVSGILAGLEHLHSLGIVHRDLKPANILLQGDHPRLTDFGLSRFLNDASRTKHTAGTPSYMPPEAFDGRYSPQSDLWATGVMLQELLVGRLPFVGQDISSLMGAIMRRDPEPLPNTIPLKLRQVVARALQKVPAKRYQTAAEMRIALLEACPAASAVNNMRNVSPQTARRKLIVGTGIGAVGFGLLGLFAWIWSSNAETSMPKVAAPPIVKKTETEVPQKQSPLPASVFVQVCTKTGLAATKYCPHSKQKSVPANGERLLPCSFHNGPTCPECGRVFPLSAEYRYCPFHNTKIVLTGSPAKLPTPGVGVGEANPTRPAASHKSPAVPHKPHVSAPSGRRMHVKRGSTSPSSEYEPSKPIRHHSMPSKHSMGPGDSNPMD